MCSGSVAVTVQAADKCTCGNYIRYICVTADIGIACGIMALAATQGVESGYSGPVVGEISVTAVAEASIGQICSALEDIMVGACAVRMAVKVIRGMTVNTF